MRPPACLLLTVAITAGCSRAGHIPAEASAPLPPAPADNHQTLPPPEPLLAGWYVQRSDATETFLPCGEAAPLRLGSADLRARARDAGLALDTPVYVRVRGKRQGSMLAVASVEQFGTATPVADCAVPGAEASPAG